MEIIEVKDKHRKYKEVESLDFKVRYYQDTAAYEIFGEGILVSLTGAVVLGPNTAHYLARAILAIGEDISAERLTDKKE